MYLKDSLAIANSVLAILQGDYELNGKHNDSIYVECYANGREHGYAILNMDNDHKAVFAGHRIAADSCIVYRGYDKEFQYSSNIPNEMAYEREYSNTTTDIQKAAQQVRAWLLDNTPEPEHQKQEREFRAQAGDNFVRT